MHFICTIQAQSPIVVEEQDRFRIKELVRENVLDYTFMAKNMKSIYLVLQCDDEFSAREIINTLDCLTNHVVSIEELIWNE